MQILLGSLLILFSILLSAAVLFQSGHSAGLSGAIAGAGEGIFGKRRGMDDVLKRITTVLAVLFLLTALLLAMLHGV